VTVNYLTGHVGPSIKLGLPGSIRRIHLPNYGPAAIDILPSNLDKSLPMRTMRLLTLPGTSSACCGTPFEVMVHLLDSRVG
jgi:hypothetical protein